MLENPNTVMPRDFPKHIHQALRSWYTRQTESVLSGLLLAHQIEMKRDSASARLVSNQILMHGLDDLKQVNSAAFDLLQRRFLNKETAREAAFSLNVTVDVVYQRQRAAITQLAQLIWSQETLLLEKQARRIESRLEPQTYTCLFGTTAVAADLQTRLESGSEPWILALEGMGGIGKTALADSLARKLACRSSFREIAWVSARRRLFRLIGNIEASPGICSSTLPDIVDQLIDQFELLSLKRLSDREKLIGVKSFLKSQPCLIVLDNLETICDYRNLVPDLRELANPSKFLITTRYSLRGESGIYILRLQGLSREDSLSLIRYEAGAQGLYELANASDEVLLPIYDVTGGNPLAMKLIIGQVHTFPLVAVLERLSMAQGQPATELLMFIHNEAWQTLDWKCRRLMQALVLVSDNGGCLDQIVAASGLNVPDAVTSLQRLAMTSLVRVSGGLNERRYALHQLTKAFVMQQSVDENP